MNVSQKAISESALKSDRIFTKDFILIWVTNFSVILGFQMTLPTIPLFVESIGGSKQIIGLVVGVFTFSALALRPFAGKSVDTKGRQFVLAAGLIVLMFSIGFYALATSLIFLFFLRLMQGIGWGLATTATGTIATDIVPVSKRGEGIGYYGLSRNLAMAIGPAVGLSLVSLLDFSPMFIIASILVLNALLLSLFIKYIPVPAKNDQISPTSRWDLFEKTAIKPALLLVFVSITFGGVSSFLPLYTGELGIKGIEFYYITFSLVMMFIRIFSGRLYDKRGIQAILIPSVILIILAMVFLTFLSSTWMLITAAILYGAGFGALTPGIQAWVINRAPNDRKGMANATFFSSFDIGIGLGAILFGIIIPWTGYSGVFAVSAFFASASILLYLQMLKNNEIEKV